MRQWHVGVAFACRDDSGTPVDFTPLMTMTLPHTREHRPIARHDSPIANLSLPVTCRNNNYRCLSFLCRFQSRTAKLTVCLHVARPALWETAARSKHALICFRWVLGYDFISGIIPILLYVRVYSIC